MEKIPGRFPAQIFDRFVTLADRVAGEYMIQLELEFAERLDIERLARAVELTLDAEPVRYR